MISINQDSLGIPASYFTPTGQSAPVSGTLYPYWSGPLSDGYVIGIVAVSDSATITVNFSDVPGLGAGTYSWKECYTGATGIGSSVSATLVAHDMAVFKVFSSGGTTSTSSVKSSSTSRTSTSSTVASKSSTISTTKSSTTSTKTSSAATTTSSAVGTLAKWAHCAGLTWTGSGTCKF